MKNQTTLIILLFASILVLGNSLYILTQILNGSLVIEHGWIWLPGIPLGLISIAYATNELKH